MKVCTVCGLEKDYSQFYKSKTYKDGYGYRCKPCDTAARKDYEKRHPARTREGHRRANLLNKYGITIEDYDSMWESQNGQCCICKTNLTNIRIDNESYNKANTACVDHCHESGKVRGLLCTTCNKALGLFHDDLVKLQTAIDYIKKHADIH